ARGSRGRGRQTRRISSKLDMRSGEASGGFPALGSGKLYRSRGLAAIGKRFARRAAYSGSVHLIRHAEASVDEQNVASYIVRCARRQKDRGAGDFGRLTPPTRGRAP